MPAGSSVRPTTCSCVSLPATRTPWPIPTFSERATAELSAISSTPVGQWPATSFDQRSGSGGGTNNCNSWDTAPLVTTSVVLATGLAMATPGTPAITLAKPGTGSSLALTTRSALAMARLAALPWACASVATRTDEPARKATLIAMANIVEMNRPGCRRTSDQA